MQVNRRTGLVDRRGRTQHIAPLFVGVGNAIRFLIEMITIVLSFIYLGFYAGATFTVILWYVEKSKLDEAERLERSVGRRKTDWEYYTA